MTNQNWWIIGADVKEGMKCQKPKIEEAKNSGCKGTDEMSKTTLQEEKNSRWKGKKRMEEMLKRGMKNIRWKIVDEILKSGFRSTSEIKM